MAAHKHAEMIKAWADGAEIEYKSKGMFGWHPCTLDPIWSSGVEYRVADPYRELKEAVAGGKVIEFFSTIQNPEERWTPLDRPKWTSPPAQYRVADPYRELKEAYAEGKQIQTFALDQWHNLRHAPAFDLPVSQYRVKPEVEHSSITVPIVDKDTGAAYLIELGIVSHGEDITDIEINSWNKA